MTRFSKLFSAATILPLIFASPALAQADHGLAAQMREWESLPEKPSLREMCSTSLRYATALENLKRQGSPVIRLLQWGVQEAERSAALMPNEKFLPIGTLMIITKQTQLLYSAEPIYGMVQGGFPQWVYRSCMKGKSVDATR